MKDLIDVHVHLCAFPEEGNGCHMSPQFMGGNLVRLVKWKLGLTGTAAAELNKSYVECLLRDLTSSARVKKAVILGLDGVYDASGVLDEANTHMLIGNRYVESLVARYPEHFLYGASINPQRRDALDELSRVIEAGARLIKVLPPSQVFDPMDKRHRDFYRMLAAKQIPLLCHIGYEFSVKAGRQEWGRPEGLCAALDEGVPVIGAHACSSAIFFQGAFRTAMDDLIRRYPNFYMDLSATTLPNRASVLYDLQKKPDYSSRLIFGTDYPLSAYATPFLGRLSPSAQWKAWRMKNIFDKQAFVLDELGIRHDPALVERLLRLPS